LIFTGTSKALTELISGEMLGMDFGFTGFDRSARDGNQMRLRRA